MNGNRHVVLRMKHNVSGTRYAFFYRWQYGVAST